MEDKGFNSHFLNHNQYPTNKKYIIKRTLKTNASIAKDLELEGTTLVIESVSIVDYNLTLRLKDVHCDEVELDSRLFTPVKRTAKRKLL